MKNAIHTSTEQGRDADDYFDWWQPDAFASFQDQETLRKELIAALADALVARYRQEHPR